MKTVRLILLLGLLSLLVAVPSVRTQAQNQASTVISFRFVNLALSASNGVDLYNNREAVVSSSLAPRLSSERFITQSGEQKFQLYPQGANIEAAAALAELTFDVKAGDTFLIIAQEKEGKTELSRYDYDFSPVDAHHARLEVLQFAADVPTISGVAQNNDILFEDAVAGEVTRVDVPSGRYQLSLRDANGEEVAINNLNATAGNLATLVVYFSDKVHVLEIDHSLEVQALVRIVHAGRITAPLDIYFDDAPIFTNISYKQGTEYKSLPQGNYAVSLYEAGSIPGDDDPLWTGDVSLSDTPLTGAVVGELNLRLITYQDDLQQIPAERARVRFINAALNLELLTVQADNINTEPLVGSLNYILGSSNLNVAPGDRSLFFKETQGAELLTLPDFQFELNSFYTFILVGNVLVDGSVEVVPLSYNWKTPDADVQD